MTSDAPLCVSPCLLLLFLRKDIATFSQAAASLIYTYTHRQRGNKVKGKKGEWTGTNPCSFIRVQNLVVLCAERKRTGCARPMSNKHSRQKRVGRSQIVPPHRFGSFTALFLPQTPLDTGTFFKQQDLGAAASTGCFSTRCIYTIMLLLLLLLILFLLIDADHG